MLLASVSLVRLSHLNHKRKIVLHADVVGGLVTRWTLRTVNMSV